MKSLLLLLLFALPICALAAPITVRVVDEAGAPVEGATVQGNRVDETDDSYAIATTDAQGTARYDLGASKFNADYFGNVAAWKAGKALTGGNLLRLKDGALTLTLRAATSVSGTVKDAKGPVEGALITIANAQNQGRYLWLGADSPLARKLGARTDSNGHFTLDGISAGAQLTLRVAGESYATQNVQAQSGGEISVQLKPGATLRGQVLGIGGAPLSKLKVIAVRQGERDGENFIETTTDSDGHYRLSGLDSGTYNVLFRAAKSAEWVVAAREGALAVAGENRELETARAVAGVVLRGRVVDAVSKAGIENITVAIFGAAQPATSQPTGAFTTDKDGAFSARVAPGASVISVLNAPQGWESANRTLKLDIGENAVVPDATIELTPAIALRGRIVDEDGKGVKMQLSLKQKYREWPINSDENGDFRTYPDFKGEVTLGRSRFLPPDEENKGVPWEVVGDPKTVLPSTEPIQIVVRRALVGVLSGTVADEKGAPVEGVKLNISVANGQGEGSTSRGETVTSNAQGIFELANIRSDQTVRLRGIEKTGYDLQSGGEISKDGNNWKVRAVKMRARVNHLAGRIARADGQSAAGAQIFAAGSETRADEKGAYDLKVLPSGRVDVFVYGDGQFGFRSAQTRGAGDAATSTDLRLSPQTLQPTDRELAGEILARARVLAAQTNSEEIRRLKLRETDVAGALETLIAAPPRRADQMTMAIYRGATNPDVSTELLLRAVRAVDDARWRLYGAAMLFAKRPDWPDDEATRELAATLSRDAQNIAADQSTSNKWAASIGLVGVAPIIERYQGEAAGQAALARAIAWIKTQYPQPGDGNLDGYLSALAVDGELVAANSPALFAQLLAAIDDQSSPAYTRALQEGLVAIAKSRGLEAAAPFLRQLRAAPNPNADGPGGATNYAARQATRQAIEAGGARSPALALQLARGLGPDNDNLEDENARALAEAAFFQPPDVAAVLWRESLPQLAADRAAQIAVRVAVKQPVVGAELLELARRKLESSSEVNWWGNSIVASFAYYEAKFDAAAARYRLEKAWQKAAVTTDDFQIRPDLVRAMAAIDGERAFEWASLLDSDDQVRALANAARYIEADERARAKVDFERWKRDETVFMD